MVVYNVVDMKRRGSPAIKYGSSGSVTETGAQQGKSSSTATIRRTEGNGQEKSSGKASAEVENRGSDNGNADSDNGKREPKYTVIDGGDTAGKESALADAYDKAVKQGKGVEICTRCSTGCRRRRALRAGRTPVTGAAGKTMTEQRKSTATTARGFSTD